MARMIVVDPDRCVSCGTCELACAVAHSEAETIAEAAAAEVKPVRRIRVEWSGEQGVPVQCRHCSLPRCGAVCPKDAISSNDTGDAVLDLETCIGCGMCTQVCPFGVVELNKPTKKALKCDLCSDRRGGPACVESCPTQALSLAEPDAAVAERLDPPKVAEQLISEAQPPEAGVKKARCSTCGTEWAGPKQLEVVSKKLGDGAAPAANICPKCRRIRTAAALAEETCSAK